MAVAAALAVMLGACSTPTAGTAGTASVTATPTAAPTSEPTLAPTLAPTTMPPVELTGVNDPGCTSIHRPVLLLHGTLSSIAIDFPVLVPALIAAGFCVYGADYGLLGTQAIKSSATAFASIVDEIRAETGTKQVDVIGFSQGGLVLRTALRLDQLASTVHTAVMISPSFHGTTSPLVGALPKGLCEACAEQAAGSTLLTELDAGGDLDGDVRYAVIVTSADQIVTPWQQQIPAGGPDRVRSAVLDLRCPGTRIQHQQMAHDQGVVGWAVAAVAAGGEVRAADLVCTPGTG